jgi:hypothetical protein
MSTPRGRNDDASRLAWNADDSASIRREDPLPLRLYLQSEMNSMLVAIADILGEKPFQILLFYRNHVIEPTLATIFDPTLC